MKNNLFFHIQRKKLEQKLLKNKLTKRALSNPKSMFYKPKFELSGDKIKIEFYLMDAFEIYHFKPVYEELLKYSNCEPIFVCEPQKINTIGNWFDYETAKQILNDLKLNYKEEVNPEAELSFTTQRSYILKKYDKIKVNFQYGTGLNKSNFCNTVLTTEGFDYRFLYSDYTRRNLKNTMHGNRMYNVGSPKQDKYYNNLPPKVSYDTNKPVLTYFSTWDDDISIHSYYEELKKLKSDFFIVTKAHHCTFRLEEKKRDLEKIYEISDVVLEGNSEFAAAAVQGDIALIDAKSGASTEVPFLNPDIKILYLSVRENLKEYFYDDIFKFGHIINDPKMLSKAVHDVYNNDLFIEKREQMTPFFMGEFDGKSTQRAISAINDILKTEYHTTLKK